MLEMLQKSSHYCFKKNATQGERLLLAKDLFTTQSNLDLIRKDFPQLDSQIPKGDLPKTEDWKKIWM